MKWLYYVFPKVFDLGNMARLALEGKAFTTWMPVWSSALFAGLMLAAGLGAFARKDY
jgi:hypothetical protein